MHVSARVPRRTPHRYLDQGVEMPSFKKIAVTAVIALGVVVAYDRYGRR